MRRRGGGFEMRPLTFIAALGAALLMTRSVVAVSALAEQDDLTCADFRHNQDGSWTALKTMTITAPNGHIEAGPGVSFTVGLPIMGIDVAATLDENCK